MAVELLITLSITRALSRMIAIEKRLLAVGRIFARTTERYGVSSVTSPRNKHGKLSLELHFLRSFSETPYNFYID